MKSQKKVEKLRIQLLMIHKLVMTSERPHLNKQNPPKGGFCLFF
jgi:hypothetical protein